MTKDGVNGPVEVQMLVHITSETQNGVATIGLGMGKYPTPQQIAERLERFSIEELPKIAPGYRLQTSVEFFDTACLEKAGQTFATPTSWQNWKPIN